MIGARVGCTGKALSGAACGMGSAATQPLWMLTKTGGVSGTYDGQAYTDESFAGTVTIVTVIGPAPQNDAWALGFAADPPSGASYTDVLRGILNDSGTMYSCASGALTSIGPSTAGSTWKIVRTMPGGAISILQDDVEVATLAASTVALTADASIRFTGDEVLSVEVTVGGVRQALTWNDNGATATEES